MKPDLSNAICYYRTRSSRWGRMIVFFLFFVLGTYGTIVGIEQGYQWNQLIGTHRPIPFFVFPALGLICLWYLIANIPGLFFYGPSIAIAKEGMYIEFSVAKLILIEWRDVASIEATKVSYGRGGSYPAIAIYLHSPDLMLTHIKENSGTVPLLLTLKYRLIQSTKPIRIITSSFEGVSREELLEKLSSEFRQNQSVPSQ